MAAYEFRPLMPETIVERMNDRLSWFNLGRHPAARKPPVAFRRVGECCSFTKTGESCSMEPSAWFGGLRFCAFHLPAREDIGG